MNNGIKNETEIVNSINGKKFNELTDNLKSFIKFAFNKINNDDVITSSKIRSNSKADIKIEVNGSIKNISIKNGSENSIHSEKLDSFISFLQDLKIKPNIIDHLKFYHYGDGTTEGNGIRRLSAEEAKIEYSDKIRIFNKYVSYDNFLSKMIERFLFDGIKGKTQADIIYYGNSLYGVWASKEEILKYLLKNKSFYIKTIHFSKLTYQNYCRNINKNVKSEFRRKYIQIKWFSIVGDLQKIRDLNSIHQNM